jgi:hypothetical protein
MRRCVIIEFVMFVHITSWNEMIEPFLEIVKEAGFVFVNYHTGGRVGYVDGTESVGYRWRERRFNVGGDIDDSDLFNGVDLDHTTVFDRRRLDGTCIVGRPNIVDPLE